MRRFLYRCPVCRTTSPVCRNRAELKGESDRHRAILHGDHYPDGEKTGAVDRRGRWYADLGLIAAVQARLADAYADIPDPNGMGRRLWADALSWLTLTATALAALWCTTTALQP
ncbi:hypothetical protein [Streptomyces natalensis]|uniref:Uncharacterized protein n=1 Tax=Streptomyces natalensis ATCC 27448 TaxID=1240678 RepID=A0A0D7CMF3_9ACTN|nr:hypothetical protein [Streptomyces natalensis]KIZ17363.1 hypothetical protein SNA_15265 [Streptomyces natalensis ATCC 27448]